MDARVIEQAVNEIALELRGTERQFEQLLKRKEELEAAMASMTKLLRGSAPLSLPPRNQAMESLGPVQQDLPTLHPVDEVRPTWMLVRELLEREGGTLTVPEIHKLINRDGIVVGNPDAIRIAMRRKPEIFSNVSGRFALRQSDDSQMPTTQSLGIRTAGEATEVAS